MAIITTKPVSKFRQRKQLFIFRIMRTVGYIKLLFLKDKKTTVSLGKYYYQFDNGLITINKKK